ncbi:hypothetical protein QQP08_027106 [Theobroma cacao]|uniref:Uncharacterized protein n=1 Tax=Theobroma cacao TaxID=3641 RepID=A0A061GXI5_THECC|nr:Uncharacterized protein TCM_039094 [Theobroma cacao]WRX34619.1 hypothetical protein QQP08_027106 [Theobroma cacao]
MNPAESDKLLESMFGREEWQFERIISEADLNQKEDIIVLVPEVHKYFIPLLKNKDAKDLTEGKAIDILLFDEDFKAYYKLNLHFSRPYFLLWDTTEFYQKKRLTVGQRLGFRYEGWFAMLVVKLLK